ncbi:hypothetical protein E4U41_001082 [Claviceps citrina]|nr:hypothetical protein E4U41_001082 [Claviceps citrina]
MDSSVGVHYQSGRTPVSGPRATGSERLPSKLRETCHACALSKVRCSKEKPSCSRCAKRGVACEYIVTKRPGRKRDPTKSAGRGGSHGNGLDAAAGVHGTDANCLWMEDMLAPVAGGDGHALLDSTPPDATQPDPNSPLLWPVTDTEGAGMAGDISDFLMPLITPLSSTFTVHTPDFLDAAAEDSAPNTPKKDQLMQHVSSVAQLLMPDMADMADMADMLDLPNSVREHDASGALSLDLLSTSSSRSLSSAPESSASSRNVHDDSASASTSTSTSTACCCLVKALDILAKLSSSDPAVEPAMPVTGKDGAVVHETLIGHDRGSPLLSATFTANRQTIEALGTMLHGSCQDNSYLLTCMSMIVFKVLGRYEVAARQSTPTEADRAADADDFYEAASSLREHRQAARRVGPGGDSLRRLSAQLVLGELHMVQQLVNRLSFRLRNSLDRQTTDDGLGSEKGTGTPKYRAGSFDDGPDMASFFSAATLSQMDHDLRKGLVTLSSNIINTLRTI